MIGVGRKNLKLYLHISAMECYQNSAPHDPALHIVIAWNVKFTGCENSVSPFRILLIVQDSVFILSFAGFSHNSILYNIHNAYEIEAKFYIPTTIMRNDCQIKTA